MLCLHQLNYDLLFDYSYQSFTHFTRPGLPYLILSEGHLWPQDLVQLFCSTCCLVFISLYHFISAQFLSPLINSLFIPPLVYLNFVSWFLGFYLSLQNLPLPLSFQILSICSTALEPNNWEQTFLLWQSWPLCAWSTCLWCHSLCWGETSNHTCCSYRRKHSCFYRWNHHRIRSISASWNRIPPSSFSWFEWSRN